ncbi:MAG TPA: molybdopterin molybdotransferase MoeA [Cyclobacteriaceae bacterium]|nr:molybdopterin molybdotransferase MoeA [Cyclobacteriaceae bacterium]
MVSVSEATQIILSNLYQPAATTCPIADAVGKVIAEKVHADRDFPPFDRVTMDGIGVSYYILQKGQREFVVEGIQAAGTPQKKLSDPSKCLEVMTGAITPEGIDVVIPYEEIVIDNGKAKLLINDFEPLQNIHKRGTDVNQGDILIEPGKILSPAEIAVLASVGKPDVKIKTLPRISIISTGDELVEVNEVPALHQIRRSNSYALQAALREMGIHAVLHHVVDEENAIEDALRKILSTSDALILSGGVSKGKFDYVPKALEKSGVKKLFHRVTQRPGKPFWFGVTNEGKSVFALPGNPVSTFMCFYKYIKPWLLRSLDLTPANPTAILASDFSFQPALTYFLQVKLEIENSKLIAYPKVGGGSGDFANLNEVDGFLELPADQNEFTSGEIFPYVGFRGLR